MAGKSKKDSTAKKKSSRSKTRSASSDGSARSSSRRAAPEAPPEGSVDFEAGLLFERYDKEARGSLTRDQFQDMWREYNLRKAAGAEEARVTPAVPGGSTFEAGQLFQRYDSSHRGAMSKRDFERLMLDLGKGAASLVGQRAPHGAAAAAPNPVQAPAMVPSPGSGFARPAYDALPSHPGFAGHLPGAIAFRNTETYTHFDETSGVPVPEERVSYHVATGHTVVPLMDAYAKRHARLCALLSRRLMPRREQLMNMVRRVRSRVEEVREKRRSIERATVQDVENIVERLRSAEALKLSTLGNQLSEVQSEVEAIDRITEQIEGARSAGGAGAGVADFGGSDAGPLSTLDIIQMFPELCAAMDKLSSRPVGAVVDVSSDDLPTEMAERLEVLRRADKYEEALALKDAMLWELLQEREASTEQRDADGATLRDFESEMASWLTLSDRMAEEITTLRRGIQDQAELAMENEQLRHEVAILRAKQSERDVRPHRGPAGGNGRPPLPHGGNHWIYPEGA